MTTKADIIAHVAAALSSTDVGALGSLEVTLRHLAAAVGQRKLVCCEVAGLSSLAADDIDRRSAACLASLARAINPDALKV
jgi:hypothetical protein